MNELSEEAELKMQGRNIRIDIRVMPDVPRYVITDPLRLRQILQNLMSNAMKFTPEGQIEISIRNVRSTAGSQLEFRVRDTGIGISLEHQKMLFQAFTQADASTTRRYGGSGLGLALSKELAQALGGELLLKESAIGKGSVFQLFLKVETPQPAVLPTVQKKNQSRPLDGARILLVEDSIDNQILVSRFLRMAGAQVETADNGQIGVEKALQATYDVIVMDIQMPVMDGNQAVRYLREQALEVPIVALTAHALSDERNMALQSGFDEYLTKPISSALLVSSLERFVPRKASELETETALEGT